MFEFELSITKALHRDHVATLAMLEKLETALNKQGGSTAPSPDNSEWRSLLSELVAILEADVKGHFAFEESRLFPIFIEYVDPGIPTMLLEEHEIIRPYSPGIRFRFRWLVRLSRPGHRIGRTRSLSHSKGRNGIFACTGTNS